MSELDYFNKKDLTKMEEHRKLFEERRKELLSEKQDEFMQGYCYAIQILLESIGNKTT